LKTSVAARCRLLTKIEQQIRYAYLATLGGVVLSAIATTYTTIGSFLFAQRPRSQPPMTPGNFTGADQFGNFAGAAQFGNMNPHLGLVNGLAMLAVIIAVCGVLWLGWSLRKLPLESHEGENASTRDKPKVE
jgi:predicted MFS family arabinose efflux permease